MKSWMLTDIRQMELRDIPQPTIQDDHDVLIKMAAVGVCGSDVHYYTTGQIGSQVVQYPFTVGHECAGVVEQVGKAVSRVKPGDRIAIDPAMSCYDCDQCRAGRHHTCRKLRFLGCPGQAAGSLSEYIVMPDKSCYPIPDSMSFDQAAISEPLAIGYYVVKRVNLKNGAKAAIFGSGPIGLSVLLSARAMGKHTIYMTDRIDARVEHARRSGCDWSGNPYKQDIVGEITAAEPLGLDVVFECCGQQEALDQGVRLLKPGGALMMVGIPEVDRVSFTCDQMRRKELSLLNIRRQVDCTGPALDLIATGRVNVDAMITHHLPFMQVDEAFDLVEHYRDGVIKAMITF
ncbi:MAG: alcohol dehydrogenase catalytic domain-containing protein [Sedimentisphaerales bacterium]|nr:alcohol dehydrogenase catalytic domain-containing protein [Sedimentisphaerales bacterium]